MLNPELRKYYDKDSLDLLTSIANRLGKYAYATHISIRSNYRIGNGIALPYCMGIISSSRLIPDFLVYVVRHKYPLMSVLRCNSIPVDTVKLCIEDDC